MFWLLGHTLLKSGITPGSVLKGISDGTWGLDVMLEIKPRYSMYKASTLLAIKLLQPPHVIFKHTEVFKRLLRALTRGGRRPLEFHKYIMILIVLPEILATQGPLLGGVEMQYPC